MKTGKYNGFTLIIELPVFELQNGKLTKKVYRYVSKGNVDSWSKQWDDHIRGSR